jgi:lysophospholipid acyltransferase (LPLAT)-like uncharacterized protein
MLLLGLLGSVAIQAWMRTLDYKVAFYDPTVDPANPDSAEPKIYVLWHEYILFPISLRGHCNLALLLSQHRDAEILSYAARHLGFDTVRGSTTRGGLSALRNLLRKSRGMSLAITPDGPRGPRRSLASGAIYLSSKTGMPLVAMGFGYERCWRLKSWDRFALPCPFTRARAVVSPPLQIPPELDREGLEHYREKVESLLNRLTTEAESWAESGHRKADQYNVTQTPLARPLYRYEREHASGRPHESGIISQART